MPQIFISYSRTDTNLAIDVEARLDNEFLDPWRDTHTPSGEEWLKFIDKKIRECICMIVIVTEAALESHYVTYEWASIHQLGKRVIPIIFSDIPVDVDKKYAHHPLRRFQFREFVNFNDQTTWNVLFDELKDISANAHDPGISRAVELLSSPIKNERIEAQNFLVEYPHVSAEHALKGAIHHASPHVSIESALALGRRTLNGDIESLVGYRRAITGNDLGLLNDIWDNLQGMALRGLGNEVGKFILALLEPDDLDNLNQKQPDGALRMKHLLIKYMMKPTDKDLYPYQHHLLHYCVDNMPDRVNMVIEGLGNRRYEGAVDSILAILETKIETQQDIIDYDHDIEVIIKSLDLINSPKTLHALARMWQTFKFNDHNQKIYIKRIVNLSSG